MQEYIERKTSNKDVRVFFLFGLSFMTPVCNNLLFTDSTKSSGCG
jgi:hypothetical protein